MNERGALSTNADDWQRHWHALLDQAGVDLESSPGLTGSLPPMDDDYRLHFGFWMLEGQPAATLRREALMLLPHGDRIARRIERHLATTPPPIPADEAVAILRMGLRALQGLVAEAPDENGTVRLIDERDASRAEVFREADTPFATLRDALPSWAERESGSVGLEAFLFLTEPTYRLASSYEVRDWVLWPLCAREDQPDLTRAPYQLRLGGWLAGYDRHGLFLHAAP